jgi:CRP/FNR family nitrogen fixation transcriptional regulator
MSRLDIADYLGLTIETVSRTLTQLQRDCIICMPATRRVVLHDRSALSAMGTGAPEVLPVARAFSHPVRFV